MENITVSVVVPMYNEEEVINESYKRLTGVMESTGLSYELIFVNDGSKDKTRLLALDICNNDKRVRMIDFARNFGHQCAITAGMANTKGDCIVVIDADLQDPPEVIPEMIEKWKEGYEVVFGQRKKREGETLFKKFTAAAFYRCLNMVTNVDIPLDTGDFRLIDRKVCDAYNKLSEHNRFVRGIFSWLGYKTTSVEFERHARFAGTSKYPFKKMLKLAFDGIYSFSYIPLVLARWLGIAVSIVSVLILIFYAIFKLLNAVTTLVIACIFIMGITLICLGFIGDYIARICDEVRNRPYYLIREKVNFDE